ncbi:MAG TPA: hypothetical protein VEN81_11175 [Planctomycetota bacterium]|nr:hypothetical protein [Planctomycetota bacterium]
MKTKLAAGLAFVLALSAQAFAQKGGGFGGGGAGGGMGPGGMQNKIRWASNVDNPVVAEDPITARRLKQMGIEPVDKKYMFVYVRPIAETVDPGSFNSTDIITLSHEAWVFVKMDYDKDNPHQKAWGLKGAPAIIGCDLHANDFIKSASIDLASIRRITGGLPEAIQRYEQKLKSDFAKANEFLKSDEPKAMKLFVEIVSDGKKGYKEVEDSATKVGDFGQAAILKSDLPESVSPEAGIDYLEEMAKIFKGTAPAVQAEIRIARLDHDRGQIQPAIQRLLGIQKYDPRSVKAEIDNALHALEDISRAGEAKVELASSGDKTLAKDSLRRLAKDYAGTDAGKKAADASKRFE